MVSVAEHMREIEQRRAEAEARRAAHDRRKNFYLSKPWRALRYRALRENAQKHSGTLTCEACGSTAGPWHVDHIKPRSRFPELELVLANLQIMCADCNTGKGNTDALTWSNGKICETNGSPQAQAR